MDYFIDLSVRGYGLLLSLVLQEVIGITDIGNSSDPLKTGTGG